MDKQELFDKAVGGVLAQGGPSIHNDTCRYRNPDGKKCAAGHLLADDEYHPDMEGSTVVHVLLAHPGAFPPGVSGNAYLVRDLQAAHDESANAESGGFFLERFRERAKRLAEQHSLEWNHD